MRHPRTSPATTVSIRLLVAASLLAAAACGSDDDSTDDAGGESSGAAQTTSGETDGAEPETTTDSGTEIDDAAETETDDVADDAADAPTGGSGGTATLTLENGEVFEFSAVLCSLEPQMAAGSEILFTATSYEDPGLDITQFGDEGTITDVASISVYDGDFETLWSADSMIGSDVELTLDGSTIRGTGSFFEGEDFAGATVAGEVVANC